MKRYKAIILLTLCLIPFIASCGKNETIKAADDESTKTETQKTDDKKQLHLYINGIEYDVVWEENEAVTALKSLALEKDITIDLSLYGGFEQVGSIGEDLPSNDKWITTVPGDIMLYSGDKIVIFFDSNTYDYTRLGRIENKTESELRDLLSGSKVTVKISFS